VTTKEYCLTLWKICSSEELYYFVLRKISALKFGVMCYLIILRKTNAFASHYGWCTFSDHLNPYNILRKLSCILSMVSVNKNSTSLPERAINFKVARQRLVRISTYYFLQDFLLTVNYTKISLRFPLVPDF